MKKKMEGLYRGYYTGIIKKKRKRNWKSYTGITIGIHSMTIHVRCFPRSEAAGQDESRIISLAQESSKTAPAFRAGGRMMEAK